MIFKRILLLAGIIFLSLSLFSQDAASFKRVEQQIESSIPRELLEQEKGWKYNYRWMDEFNKRVDPQGNFYDGSVFYREAERLANRNQSNLDVTNSWIPVGPVERASSSLTKGMGRINCISFHPTDVNTYWVGVAQGGVWKTTNDGDSWTPLTDNLPILRISDIAVDPNNTDIIYISVGDYAYIDIALNLDNRKRHTHYGIGVYKTTDGGTTWNPTGLTYQLEELDGSLIRRVMVDPNNSNRLVAAGVGGVLTSIDAGDNWTLTHDNLMWDLEADPNDPYTLYGCTGYLANSEVGTAGIIKSTDFGSTWMELNTGIPETGVVTRTEVTVAPSNSNHIYALTTNVNSGLHGIYSSLDGGQTWSFSDAEGRNILEWYDGFNTGGQGRYDLSIVVHPTNENIIYTGGVNVWGSNDGGQTFDGVSIWFDGQSPGLHADQHQFKINPLDNKIYICNDGGLVRTDSIEIGSWDNFNFDPDYQWPTNWEYLSDGMQTSSFYRVGVSEGNPGNFIAGAQDNSTYFNNGGFWSNLFGGDGMNAILHPSDPNIIIGSSQFGRIIYSDDGGFTQFRMSNPQDERAAWTTPFMFKPGNTDVVYGGFGNLYQAPPGNEFFDALSDFPNMNGVNFPTPIAHFNVSNSNPNYMYVAKRIYHSFDQMSELWATNNNGITWNNVTAGLPDSLYFSFVEVDENDPLSVWVVMGGFEPGQHVYHSLDGGNTWINETYDLPNLPVNCIVHNDSSMINTVYIGTDIGIYYSNDTLDSWIPYNLSLPNVIVSDIDINYGENKLYAATFGRGVWQNDLIDESELPTSLEPINPFNGVDIELSPNPNDGQFKLSIKDFETGNLKMEIIDVMGRIIESENLNIDNNNWSKDYELDLPDGMYFLKLSSEKRMRSIQFIVK